MKVYTNDDLKGTMELALPRRRLRPPRGHCDCINGAETSKTIYRSPIPINPSPKPTNRARIRSLERPDGDAPDTPYDKSLADASKPHQCLCDCASSYILFACRYERDRRSALAEMDV